jgi:hypothetical protein
LSVLGLRILGITEENKQDGHNSLLVLARQKYHYYARLLHPDKCKQKNAASAFIILSKLIDFVSRKVQSSRMKKNPYSKMQQTLLLQSTEDMRSNARGSASSSSSFKIDLQHRLTWSQNRLVVLGYRMYTELQARYLQRYSAVTQELLQSEELTFLPLRNLPTINSNLKKEEVISTIAGEVGHIMQEMISSISGEASHLSSMVDGLLLVPSRSALQGRFPLNGTYFQINEVFLDQSTVSNNLKVIFLSLLQLHAIDFFLCSLI